MVEKVYKVNDMSCAACSARVKRTTSKLDGVAYCDVNLLTEKMTVGYDETRQSFESLRDAVVKAGYGLEELNKAPEARETARKRTLRPGVSVLISALCALPILYLNINHMIPGAELPAPAFIAESAAANAAVQLALTAVVIFLCRGFFTRGAKAALAGSPNMDTLVALGVTAAMGESIYAAVLIFAGAREHVGHLYCESAAMVLTLVSLGRWLEDRAKVKTGDALRSLEKLRPAAAHVLREGVEYEKDAALLQRGDVILVRPGEAVPADAVILEGSTGANEALLTGESLPVEKKPGDSLIGGSLNLDGAVKAEVTAEAEESLLSKIIGLVEDAQNRQAPVARLADKVAGVFVPTVIIIALLAALGWAFAGKGAEFCINIAIAVLVVACPCALGLATPCSIMTGTGRGASLGVLFKSGEALEQLSSVKAVVFDKTGTLTKGSPRVSDVLAYGLDRDTALNLCASAEYGSEHPVGRAIVTAARDYSPAANMRAIPGRGVEAEVEGGTLLAGNLSLMRERNIDVSAAEAAESRLSGEGKTLIYAALGGALIALIAVEDELREGCAETVERIRGSGREVYMLTGDNIRAARSVARRCGIDEDRVIAGVLPGKKSETIAELRKKTPVAMVGDGVNDAPALTEATVGVAMAGGGRAADIAVDAADVVLMRGETAQVWDALSLSAATMRNIRQNLFWAFAYNTVCIPAAAGIFYAFGGGLLSPVWAGAAMAASSVCVVSNALRLRRFRVK